MFHAVGLKVIDNKLKKSEVLLQSKSAPIIAVQKSGVVRGRLILKIEIAVVSHFQNVSRVESRRDQWALVSSSTS